jgi:hypothetical protein
VAEQIERLLDVVERVLMRDERGQVHAMVLDHRHQPTHTFLDARAERGHDLLIAQTGVERLVRRNDFAGVDAEAGERPAGSNGPERRFEGLLTAERGKFRMGWEISRG